MFNILHQLYDKKKKTMIYNQPMVNLENITAVYYYIAVFATIVFVMKTLVFTFIGGDAEVISDFTTEFEAETSFDFLSVQSILAFFMGFGWSGLAALKQWELSIPLSTVISIAFGLVLMFFSAYLMFLVKKLNHKVVKNYKACIGGEAKAYTAFKPEGNGQIEITVSGKLSIENAVNVSKNPIEAFSQVKVTDYKDNVFYIE